MTAKLVQKRLATKTGFFGGASYRLQLSFVVYAGTCAAENLHVHVLLSVRWACVNPEPSACPFNCVQA